MYLTMYVRMTPKGEEGGKEEEGKGGGEGGNFQPLQSKNILVMVCFNMVASFLP